MNSSERIRASSAKRTAWGLLAILCSLFALRCPGWAANDSYYDYLRGQVEERAGNTAKALEAYEKVVQEDPQALEAYRDIAELRLRMNQPEAAVRAAQHVKELAPDKPDSFLFLGNVLVAQGDLAKAAEAYDKALKLDPQNLRALENLGNYYAMLDPDKALGYYQRYLDINPHDADLYFQMALVYQKKGKIEKAQELYHQSLAIDPEQVASHLALADIYDAQKSTTAAVDEYKTALQLESSSAVILMRLGGLYYRDQKWDEAWKTFQAAQALTPQDPTVYYWMARIEEEKRMWKEAAAFAEKAYTISQDAQFLPLTAYYLTLDRQLDAAIKYLEKAKESDPANANVYLFLGIDYLDLDKPDKARDALVKGAALYPKDTQMRFQLAIAEDRLGHTADAIREFQDLLTLDPKNAAAMNYLGYSWADQGVRLEEAEKLLRQAVAMDPANGAYLDSLGWVRFKRGDNKEARTLLEKAVYLSPDPLIYDHLGDVTLADKHPEIALQAWTKALAMDPKNEAIRKKIDVQGPLFFNSPDSPKYSLYMEGNLRQVQNAQADLAFNGALNKHALDAAGKLTYQRPDQILLDVPAAGKIGPMQFFLKEGAEVVRPEETNPMLRQMAFQGLSSFAQFLSGKITGQLHVTLDLKTGIQTRFSRPNPSGGQDEISIVSYDFIEGLWLPAEIHIQNSTIGWNASLKLSNWALNQEGLTFHLQ